MLRADVHPTGLTDWVDRSFAYWVEHPRLFKFNLTVVLCLLILVLPSSDRVTHVPWIACHDHNIPRKALHTCFVFINEGPEVSSPVVG